MKLGDLVYVEPEWEGPPDLGKIVGLTDYSVIVETQDGRLIETGQDFVYPAEDVYPTTMYNLNLPIAVC